MTTIVSNANLVDDIDDILPQSQCGLCGYNGCRPYAKAISQEQETIDKCLPGGIKTLIALSALTGQDYAPFLTEMEQKAKPPVVAMIREADCIGCTKCIQACPVDAIIGASKQMHTVMADYCTGCELCIKPCPVDCIELIESSILPEAKQKQKAATAKQHFINRTKRLEGTVKTRLQSNHVGAENLDAKKTTIAEIMARYNAKKSTS